MRAVPPCALRGSASGAVAFRELTGGGHPDDDVGCTEGLRSVARRGGQRERRIVALDHVGADSSGQLAGDVAERLERWTLARRQQGLRSAHAIPRDVGRQPFDELLVDVRERRRRRGAWLPAAMRRPVDRSGSRRRSGPGAGQGRHRPRARPRPPGRARPRWHRRRSASWPVDSAPALHAPRSAGCRAPRGGHRRTRRRWRSDRTAASTSHARSGRRPKQGARAPPHGRTVGDHGDAR